MVGGRADHCLVEGVMGLFDGRGPGLEGSSAELAQLLELPVVLVVEASRQAGSVAALVRGFRDHQPGLAFAGVVLNGVRTERHQALLSEALAAIAMPLLGMLPRHPCLELPSRHLGLLPAHELADLERSLGEWAALAERHLALDRLLPLLAPPASPPAGSTDPIRWCLERGQARPVQGAAAGLPAPVTLAIASDAAFHFRYPEASELLEGLGVVVRPWQPLADEPLPPGSQGVILPGGFPELHAAGLAASARSLADLGRAAAAGLPIYAECGGLLLLGEQLVDPGGVPYPMAGLLPFSARRGALQLGYRQASPLTDGLVVRRGRPSAAMSFTAGNWNHWSRNRSDWSAANRSGSSKAGAGPPGRKAGPGRPCMPPGCTCTGLAVHRSAIACAMRPPWRAPWRAPPPFDGSIQPVTAPLEP